jgi:hypothetical protein
LNILKKFLLEYTRNKKVLEMLHKLNKIISKIQKKVVNLLETKYSKIEVLINYWDKLYGQLYIKSFWNKD